MCKATAHRRILAPLLAMMGYLGGCSGDPGGPLTPAVPPPPPPPPPAYDLIVSDTTGTQGLSRVAAVASTAPDAGDDVAYVSLTPGTAPTAASATIQVVGGGTPLLMTVRNGGFDPVPLVANVGDSVQVVAQSVAGTPVAMLGVKVRPARPPIVVRSDPPRRKTDVPLNAPIVVVFSEPVDGGTVTTGSVQLFRGTSQVAGTVRVLEGTGAVVVFVPTTPLTPNTEYRLEVTTAIRDRDGDALQAGETVTFTTGQTSLGPPASIRTSPDSTLSLVVGATYQVTATVRDAADNLLIDPPVTWSVNPNNPDFGALTVSPSGLLEALGDGFANVIASVGGVSDVLYVFISAQPAASVTVAPTPATVAQGDTIFLAATTRDAQGRVINHPTVTWTSSDSAVATVRAASSERIGTVIGVKPGSVAITATSGTASGTAAVTVGPPVPVGSVTVTPNPATVLVRATVQLTATLRDAAGRVIGGRPVAWSSDNEAVATVDANGQVTGLSLGSAEVIATSEGVSDTGTITVTALRLASISAGREDTCGLTPNGTAYCWGWNRYGGLGNGSTNSSSVPVAVSGGLTFSSLDAVGGAHTCGLVNSQAAYCWGWNEYYQLGLGVYGGGYGPEYCNQRSPFVSCSQTPVAVVGGRTFTQVSASSWHTCGITPGGAAYCWGDNYWGQLGDGSELPSASAWPVAVIGGLTFVSLSAGFGQTCGVATSGAVYCWGDNSWGQLGDGSTLPSGAFPVAVTGALTFNTVTAGSSHVCGLTAAGAAYCWGFNDYGQLGDGSTNSSSVPVAVSGAFTFTALTAGDNHTCGLTTGGAAYCWGANGAGNLGDGSTNPSSVPLPVTGGLTFVTLSVGGAHTCGLATSGAAYCWGDNYGGQLGDGSTTNSSMPVKVAGQP